MKRHLLVFACVCLCQFTVGAQDPAPNPMPSDNCYEFDGTWECEYGNINQQDDCADSGLCMGGVCQTLIAMETGPNVDGVFNKVRQTVAGDFGFPLSLNSNYITCYSVFVCNSACVFSPAQGHDVCVNSWMALPVGGFNYQLTTPQCMGTAPLPGPEPLPPPEPPPMMPPDPPPTMPPEPPPMPCP